MGNFKGSVLTALTAILLGGFAATEAQAQVCVFGGKKCRERKAEKLRSKLDTQCANDPTSSRCSKLRARYDKLLTRKNMGAYAKKHHAGYNEQLHGTRSGQFMQQRQLASIKNGKELCTAAGLPPSGPECTRYLAGKVDAKLGEAMAPTPGSASGAVYDPSTGRYVYPVK